MPTFVVDEFKGGKVRSSVGDEGCIASNSGSQLNLTTPPEQVSSVLSLVADTSLTCTKSIYFVPGVVLQVTHPTVVNSSIMVEVSAVVPVNATDARLDLVPGHTFGASFIGGAVSVAQNFVRGQVTYGSVAAPLFFGAAYVLDGNSTQNLQVPGALWVGNQWAGQQVVVSGAYDGTGPYTVYGNSADTLFVESGAFNPASPVQVAIAPEWTSFTPFSGRIPAWEATALARGMTTLLYPQLDLERKGTPWYGHNHLLSGAEGQPQGGASTSKDINLKVTTPGLVDLFAKTAGLSPDGLTIGLLPTTLMTVDEHVGKYLNPNQWQTTIFKIVSNTATSITVDANMDGAFDAGEIAYVIGPRVSVKYQRVLDHLRSFVNPDARIHVLFT